MSSPPNAALVAIEPRLRSLLPADLYAAAWVHPDPATLTRVFNHLRTLRYILRDYLPRQITETLPRPGEIRYGWKEGTLMFTDLAGFTPFVAAFTGQGAAGANALLGILNDYFAEMLEIISKSGGNLLEFTGDALLAEFPRDRRERDTGQAVRAGLRMQRAMVRFQDVPIGENHYSLSMRVGIHSGRFVTADIGTPRRMDHVMLGKSVHQAKLAESEARNGSVCLTAEAVARTGDAFRYEPVGPGYALVVDDLSDEALGGYDITPIQHRMPSLLLTDRSQDGLLKTIEEALELVEPLASYLPLPILNLIIENARQRHIPPNFAGLMAIFVNLIGIPESVDAAQGDEMEELVSSFSRLFAMINARVETHGGVLKKVTYHLVGSDMIIYFGAPNAHTDDPLRAAKTVLGIRQTVEAFDAPAVAGRPVRVTCKIGMSWGPAFVGEVGEPRGRREVNIHSEVVNLAARLMGLADENQILMTAAAHEQIGSHFPCQYLGEVTLKGKKTPLEIYSLGE